MGRLELVVSPPLVLLVLFGVPLVVVEPFVWLVPSVPLALVLPPPPLLFLLALQPGRGRRLGLGKQLQRAVVVDKPSHLLSASGACAVVCGYSPFEFFFFLGGEGMQRRCGRSSVRAPYPSTRTREHVPCKTHAF